MDTGLRRIAIRPGIDVGPPGAIILFPVHLCHKELHMAVGFSSNDGDVDLEFLRARLQEMADAGLRRSIVAEASSTRRQTG